MTAAPSTISPSRAKIADAEVGQEPSDPGELVCLSGARGQNPRSLNTRGMGVRGGADRFQSRLGAGKGKCSFL